MLSKFSHSLAVKALTWFVLVLLLDSAALIVFFQLLSTTEAQAEQLQKSMQTSLLTSELADTLMQVDVAFGRFIKNGDPQVLSQVGKKIKQFNETLKALKLLFKDKPEQLNVITELESLKGSAVSLIEATNLTDATGGEKHLKDFGHGVDQAFQPLAQKLEADLAILMRSQYHEQQIQINNQIKTRSEFKYLLLFGCLGNMILSFALSIVFVRNISNRLSRLVDNMVRFESNNPLRPVLAGNDEIVFLDRKFHEMSEVISLNRQRERMATDYASDLFLAFDQYGKFLSVSQASVNFWGFEPDELIGKEVLDLIAPEDRKEFVECSRLIKSSRTKKNFEGKVVTADEVVVDTLWTFNWVEEEKSMFCVAHDNSEHKRNERLLAENELRVRTIIESIPVGLAVLDTSGRVLFLNEMLLQMLGTTLEQLSSSPLNDFFDVQSKFNDYFNRSEIPRGLIETCIVRNLLPNIPVEVTFAEINLRDNRAVLCTILDIRERKKIEAAREQFLHMITHDMRTPLTSASGYFQLLQTDVYSGRPDAYQLATQRASRNISEVIDLISNLLDVNKLKADNFELVKNTLPISKIIDAAIASVVELTTAKGIDIVAQRSKQVVSADDKLVGRALVNLLSNACKFSPTGSLITISTKTLTGCVQVSVSDEGRGVPPSEQERIFETYAQASVDDFKAGEGTGLGLAICKRIIEAHGGSIGVESNGGSGSTFWFTLPL